MEIALLLKEEEEENEKKNNKKLYLIANCNSNETEGIIKNN